MLRVLYFLSFQLVVCQFAWTQCGQGSNYQSFDLDALMCETPTADGSNCTYSGESNDFSLVAGGFADGATMNLTLCDLDNNTTSGDPFADPYIVVYDNAGNIVAQGAAACGTAGVSFTADAALGPYVIAHWSSADGVTCTSVSSCSYLVISDFPACVIEAPDNNDCAAATPITTINLDGSCTNVTSGTTLGATESLAGCVGTANDDVWFSFVATSTSVDVSILNIVTASGTSVDVVHEVFDACAGTSLGCSDPNDSSVSGLVSGNTYYVRVFSYFATSSQNFDVCIKIPPPPLANDNCMMATPLTVEETAAGACGATTAGTSVDAATYEAGTTCTTGGGATAKDVWYSMTVPANGEVTIETGDAMDTVMEAFDGACGSLNSLGCDDDGAPTGSSSQLDLTGLVPGATIFVRIWEYSNNASGAWTICARTALTILPLELISFNGDAQARYNMLKWETANEVDIDYFMVESSINGMDDWEVLGEVKAEGGDSQGYYFKDEAPASSRYYRLASMEVDGKSTYSDVILLERKSDKFDIVNLYPQPAQTSLTLEFESLKEETVTVQLYSIMGKLVQEMNTTANTGFNRVELDINQLSKGIYLLEMNQLDQKVIRKVVID